MKTSEMLIKVLVFTLLLPALISAQPEIHSGNYSALNLAFDKTQTSCEFYFFSAYTSLSISIVDLYCSLAQNAIEIPNDPLPRTEHPPVNAAKDPAR
jgi:ABC-type transport system involved in cytochrome c biogenesis permease component